MSLIRKVTGFANAFGHVPAIARLNLLASILMLPFCGLAIRQMVLSRSLAVLSLPGNDLSPSAIGGAVILFFIISLSILLDRSVWRAALKKGW